MARSSTEGQCTGCKRSVLLPYPDSWGWEEGFGWWCEDCQGKPPPERLLGRPDAEEWSYWDKDDPLRALVIHLVKNRDWYAPEGAADQIIALVRYWTP